MIKQLMKSIREYKKASLLSPLFVTLEVIIEVLIPYVMSRIIDNGIEKGNLNYILITGGSLVLLAFVSLTFGAFSGRYAAIASAGFAKNLRKDMFQKIQTFSFSNIDKFLASSLVTRLTTDVTNLQNAYQMIVRVAVRAPIMILFAYAMSVKINVQISLIFLVIIPFLGFSLYWIIRSVHPLFVRIFKTYDKLNGVVQEDLRGIRVVKSYVREDHEISKFNSVSQKIFTMFTKAERFLVFNGPLIQFSIYACIISLSWFGAKLIVNSGGTALTTGELTGLFSYTMQILMNLVMLSMVFVMIIISRTSAERISEILSEESNLKNPQNPVMKVPDGSVTFKNVSFSYQNDINRLCLKHVDLSIKSGEVIGIIGGTGTSKSSLVQLIPRLYDATEGEVLVGNTNVKDYDLNVLRDSVAVVLQKNELFSGTIKENLRWGNKDATDEELFEACRLAQADSFIKNFPNQYDTYIEQGGNNVSGGQKQRLCIARALLKKPKILILDDSTSAVDTKTDSLIRKAFAESIPDTTKIIVAQRISSIENADRIIVMDNGEIKSFGTHEELLQTSDIYKDVYESQTGGAVVHE